MVETAARNKGSVSGLDSFSMKRNVTQIWLGTVMRRIWPIDAGYPRRMTLLWLRSPGGILDKTRGQFLKHWLASGDHWQLLYLPAKTCEGSTTLRRFWPVSTRKSTLRKSQVNFNLRALVSRLKTHQDRDGDCIKTQIPEYRQATSTCT